MSFALPAELEGKFSEEEVATFVQLFKDFDADGNNSIDHDELIIIMKELGEEVDSAAVTKLIAEVDIDKSGTIEFDEFCHVINNFREGLSEAGFGDVVKKHAELHEYKGVHGTHHYAVEELIAFTEHINIQLADDEYLSAKLPLNPKSKSLFDECRDGILMCKLINKAVPETIDERAINFPKKRDLNPWEIKENQNLAINAAKAIGCTVVNVHATDLDDRRPHIILALLWQIIQIQLLSAINLKDCPQIVKLLEDGEELSQLLKLSPEDLLRRWFNYHLRNAGSDRRVSRFGTELKDCVCFAELISQIHPSLDKGYILSVTDKKARADKIIEVAKDCLNVSAMIRSHDILVANKRLLLAFCAQIFNEKHGLDLTTEELEELEKAGITDMEEGDNREELVFRTWINSLGIEGVHVKNLFDEFNTDVSTILKIINAVEPGVVDWKKVNKKPKMRIHRILNANYVVDLGKQLGFSLVGIGGIDFIDGNNKLMLAYTWQLMRHAIGLMLKEVGGGKAPSDNDIVKWANTTILRSGKEAKMRNFRDKSLHNGQFFLQLLGAIEPRVIDWDIVSKDEDEASCASNAKYIISIARKLGAVIFLTWEDICEVNPKMIMTLCGSLMWLQQKRAASK